MSESSPICPISSDFLPPHMRKHVEAASPVALRMMAAKGLVPLSPSDLVGALFILGYDTEASIREAAAKTLAGLPDRIATTAFRDEELDAPVLALCLNVHSHNDAYVELLILNPTTPDDAIAAISPGCSKKNAELLAQNQLRLLRTDDIIRGLARNPMAQGALLDGVCDFAVRSGLNLPDVPEMLAARIRLFGPSSPQTIQATHDAPTAEEVINEFNVAAENAAAPPLEEGKKLTLSQRVMKMNVAEKIKLATKGNKEVRGILIRDSNKLVAVAVIRSPRITDGEVLTQAQNKVALDDVLRVIYSNREWLRQYAI